MFGIGQMIVSLFTTGGKINPIAMVLFVGSMLYGYDEIKDYLKERELARQATVVQEACEEQVETLKEATNEKREATEAIRDGSFNNYLERLQRDD